MDLSRSTETSRDLFPLPSDPHPWSPTSATQGLSNPGSFPASESKEPLSPMSKSPAVVPGSAFEVQVFNDSSQLASQINAQIDSHSEPVFVVADAWMPPMQRLFSRIHKNDREFIQQLPALRAKQMKRGIHLNDADPVSGNTPLTAALKQGHLGLAVDLLMLGADPTRVDSNGRMPVAVAGADSMGSMVLHFMTVCKDRGTQCLTESEADEALEELLDKIDDHTGHSLLTWAISQCHDRLVERLLKRGADLALRNRFGLNALEQACTTGSLATVSRLLDSWPKLVSDSQRHYLVDAIWVAAKANRPMVIAELLSFFRFEFRSQQVDPNEAWDESPLDRITSKASTQRDAYAWFLGAQPEKQPTLENILRRTHDNFLLTTEESRCLGLNQTIAFAQQNGLQKIIDIIHAHAKLRVND